MDLKYDVFYMHHISTWTHSSAYYTAYTDVCQTYHNTTAHRTVFLKMNLRVRNM